VRSIRKLSTGCHSGRNRRLAGVAAAAHRGSGLSSPVSGSRCRDRMLRTTSAEWTPPARASAQAASTAVKPSVSTADSTLTIWRSPIVRALQLTPHTLQAGRQEPVLEGGAVTQCAGLPGEHWHVMPGIIDRLSGRSGGDARRPLTVTVTPLINTISGDQSNWYASPGAKLSGT